MKILWLYKYDPSYNFDHWFHMDMVEAIRKEGHECWAYGPKIADGYSKQALVPYNRYLLMEDLYKQYRFDVAIVVTQSRMFSYYRPALVQPIMPERKEGCWLPEDFSTWSGPKVVLEEDYHYENNNNWYKEMNINLVLQRHYTNVDRFYKNDNKGIKCLWHPFSVDENVFKPSSAERLNKICLVGSIVKNIYGLRAKALEVLGSKGILDHPGRVMDGQYVNCLQSYVSHFSCSSIFDITPAKMFEIMSSGSVLFTQEDNGYGLKELFPKDCYVTYKRDGSDLLDRATKILNDPEWVKQLTDNGRKCILERHTHSKRISQMINIFKKEFISCDC